MRAVNFVRGMRIGGSFGANQTFDRTLMGRVWDNAGAVAMGATTWILPTDAQQGDYFVAYISDPAQLSLTAGPSGIFIVNGVSSTAGQRLVNAGNVGDEITLMCVGTNSWRSRGKVDGTWTATN